MRTAIFSIAGGGVQSEGDGRSFSFGGGITSKSVYEDGLKGITATYGENLIATANDGSASSTHLLSVTTAPSGIMGSLICHPPENFSLGFSKHQFSPVLVRSQM